MCTCIPRRIILPYPGFIDFIVAPTYEVCGDLMELIVREMNEDDLHGQKSDLKNLRLWSGNISENRTKWKLQCKPKGDNACMTTWK